MMRTRSKLLDPVVYQTTGKVRSATSIAGLASKPWTFPLTANGNSFRQDSLSMTDQKTPGFFKAKRENTIIPCSPMDSSKTEYMMTPGVCQIIVKSSSSYYESVAEGYFWYADGPFAAKPTVPSVDGNIPLQEALARAQSDCYDALTFAAEFRKTVEGVVTLRTRALTLWERFDNRVRLSAKAKRFRGMEMSKILSEIWLELRYMWRPLVYDFISAQEAIRRLAEGIEDPLQRAYGTRDGSASSSRTIIKSGSIAYKDGSRGGLSGQGVTSNQTVTVEKKLHAAVGLQVTTRDITMVDPFVTGWELIPYSFVFDWFITLGDTLTAFSPFATGQLKYATLSTEVITTFRSVNQIAEQAGLLLVSGTSTPCTLLKVETSYSRVLASPVPTLAFDVNLNAAKILDLVALTVALKAKSITRLLRHF